MDAFVGHEIQLAALALREESWKVENHGKNSCALIGFPSLACGAMDDTKRSKASRSRGIRRWRQFDGIHAGPANFAKWWCRLLNEVWNAKNNKGHQTECLTQPKVMFNHPKWWMINTKMGSWLGHRTPRPRWCKGCGHLGPQRFHPKTLG